MRLQIVSRKTSHPCAGMTPAQRRDFELIAINQRPLGGYKTLGALERRGLIKKDEPKVIGRDALGPIKIPQWHVPLPIHMQWCKWASEQQTPGA